MTPYPRNIYKECVRWRPSWIYANEISKARKLRVSRSYSEWQEVCLFQISCFYSNCSILCLISSNKMGYETRKIRNVVLLYQKYFLISILCNILIVPFYAQLKPHVDICMKITKCYGTQRDIVSLNHIIILFQSDLLPEECQNFHLYVFHRNTFTFGIETYGWFRRVWITYRQFYNYVIVLS